MRILMVHPHDIYSRSEPWTVRMTYLAQEFVRRGHEVKLVYHLLDPQIPLEEAQGRQDYPYETIPQVRYSTTLVKRIPWFVSLARWSDVIHFQKCFSYVSLPAVASGYLLGKPVHYDWDDWEFEIYNYRPQNERVGSHIDYLERVLPRMVDTVSVASEVLHDLAVERGAEGGRIFEAHVGADLERFHPTNDGSRVLREHDLDGKIVLYLGQLHGAQYCELFLQAAQAILHRRNDVTFLVVGSGDRFGELHRLAEELGVAHNVVFTGAVAHERVPEYVAAADVAVACFEDTLQTRSKSPLKIVEYLAAGKAIVATRMGEAEKMIEGCGIAVPPGEIEALTDAVCEFLDNEELRRRMGRLARRRAEVKYNWGVTAENLLQAYEVGLSRRRRLATGMIVPEAISLLKRVRRRALPEPTRRFVASHRDLIGILDGEHAYTGPRLVQIDLTNDCNNDCIACWCNSPLLGKGAMSADEKRKYIPFENVVALLDELKEMGTSEIYLAGGGEPFMHPAIMDVLKAIKQRRMICFVNTNFTLVDQTRAEEMAGMGVDHLTVSVWAGTPEVYSLTHPNKTEETFEQLREVLLHLNGHKGGGPPYVKLYNVISKINWRDVEAMVEFARATRCESVEFTVVDTVPGATDHLLLDDQERAELHERCLRLRDRVENPRPGERFPLLFQFEQFLRRISGDEAVSGEYDKQIVNSLPCTIGWTFTRVLPDGKVNSCLKAHRIPIGDIYTASFRELWNSDAQIRFRKNTNVFDKKGPFFSLIGNDPEAAVGCYKSCDDLARNQTTFARLNSLSAVERRMLKAAQLLLKARRSYV